MQSVANGLFAASLYCLLGVSLSLVYSVSRVLHLGTGAAVALGGYSAAIASQSGFSVPAVFAASLAGGLMAESLLRLISLRSASRQAIGPVGAFMLSFSYLFLAESSLAAVFGPEPRRLYAAGAARIFELFGARLVWYHIASIAVALTVVAAWAVLARTTSFGRGLRGISENVELARAVGFQPRRWNLATHLSAGAISGFVGLVLGLDSAVTPGSGTRYVLFGVSAMLLGGGDSIPGAALGALGIAALQQVSAQVLPVEWQDSVVFLLLACLVASQRTRLRGTQSSWSA